jgi:hypothetical protein
MCLKDVLATKKVQLLRLNHQIGLRSTFRWFSHDKTAKITPLNHQIGLRDTFRWFSHAETAIITPLNHQNGLRSTSRWFSHAETPIYLRPELNIISPKRLTLRRFLSVILIHHQQTCSTPAKMRRFQSITCICIIIFMYGSIFL